ncbi:MAG: nuclear transport factor 2 family protein [Pseudomonadota bacterium]
MTDTNDQERDVIEAVVQDYFLGMYEGDEARLTRIFHDQCWLFGENPNGCHAFPVAGFIAQMTEGTPPKAAGEPFDMALVALDRTGSVATAKLAVRYQGRRYTDYLTLQKADGAWRIVGKLFYTED